MPMPMRMRQLKGNLRDCPAGRKGCSHSRERAALGIASGLHPLPVRCCDLP